jgi:hypothetical protein
LSGAFPITDYYSVWSSFQQLPLELCPITDSCCPISLAYITPGRGQMENIVQSQ